MKGKFPCICGALRCGCTFSVLVMTLCYRAMPQALRGGVGRCLQVLQAMNAACNPDKFGLIHYVYHKGKIKLQTTIIQVEPGGGGAGCEKNCCVVGKVSPNRGGTRVAFENNTGKV